MKSTTLNYPSLNLQVLFERKSVRARALTLGSRVKHKRRPFFLVSNGPIEVLKSIEMGLVLEGAQLEPFPRKTLWVLSGQIPNHMLEDKPEESILLLGPNVEFQELDTVLLENKFYTVVFLVPSAWVVPVLAQRLDIAESKIMVWPSGIDTKIWNPNNSNPSQALVYLKGDRDQRFSDVIEYLKRASIDFTVIQYGEYSQRVFRKELSKSKFAIWIGGTESQGIALMESWAMNVPTFVFRRSSYFDPITKQKFQASSSPYLNELVGQFSSSEDFKSSDMDKFMRDLEFFRPREYIINNLEICKAIVKLRYQVSSLVT